MPRDGHRLNPEERDLRNARINTLFAKMCAEGECVTDAMRVLATRFGISQESIKNILKKDASA